MMGLTADRVRELLRYNPENGSFIWLKSSSNRAKNGTEAGSVTDKGYIIISIGRRRYPAHRLAWLYMTGEWPEYQIDHRNLTKADNRWNNLRSASNALNHANTPIQKNNTSGFKGVTWHKGAGKWMAQIRKDGRQIYLGLFANPEDAHTVFVATTRRLNGEFARAA